MNPMKKVIFSIIILFILCFAQGVLAKEQYGMANLSDNSFRDDSPTMGIDNSQPNPYLSYNLNKKLYSAKMELLGYPDEQIAQGITEFGFPPGNSKPGLSSKGNQKLLVFLVDFPDVPHGASQTVSAASAKLNGPGDPAEYPFESVNGFYSRSSYNQLYLTSDVYGWYRAKHNREYYNTTGGREGDFAIIEEVLDAYNSQVDYSQYDRNNDGLIDGIYIFYTGSDNGWGNFWWYYKWDVWTTKTWHGVSPREYAKQWYANPWSASGPFSSARNPCHEIGHLLGLPDYYDYNSTVGPDGGVGGFDMMHGNWPDHNTFSKYLLDWTQPIVIGGNPHDTSGALYPVGDSQSQNSVMIMPGLNPNSWSEFFLTENRNAGYGNDPNDWTKDGLTVWHVDATLDPATQNFKYDNSYTSHKLLRLMEADGNEDIENNRGWDQNDIYGLDQFFGPTTTPNSNNYAGSDTLVHVQNIEPSSFLDVVWARWMIGEYPPTVTSMSPNTGTQNTLLSVYDLEGSNFWSHPKPKVYFWYRLKVGTFYIWLQDYATNVTVVSRNKITCTFDLKGVPTGQYTIYVENPDGETGSLSNGLTVTSPWIRVTVPNGGEKWASGTSHTVTWTQAGLDDTNVRIDLWKEWPVGKYQRSVAASVPANDGSYVWSIPTDVAPSTDYWVNISSISYPTVNDYTDGWLEISAVPQPLVSVKKYISSNNASWNDTSIDVSQGAKVYYNVTVKNTGNCVLTSVSFADGSSYATYSMLQPGASWILYYSATAGASDYTNTATVGASSPWGNAPAATDSATYHVIKPAVMIQPTLTEIGQKSTKTVNIVMDKAPTGLSGYKLTITPTNPQITEVLSVTFPAWAGKHSNSTLPGDIFWMRAVDDSDLVKPGARSILLGSLTVRGDQCGTTVFNIGADQFDDDSGNPISPSTVSGTIRVVPIVAPLPGYTSFPTDPDSDGIYEDLNGNGRLDFADVVLYFNQMEWIALYEPVCAFDLNGNGRIDFADIVKLFGEI